MKLYHLTCRIFAKNIILKPRMFRECMYESGGKRICLAPSIQDCANACYGLMYGGGGFIPKGLCSVYEVDIDENDVHFVSNKFIVDMRLVFDGDQYGECWVTKPITAHRVALVKVKQSKEYKSFKPLRVIRRARHDQSGAGDGGSLMYTLKECFYNVITVKYVK